MDVFLTLFIPLSLNNLSPNKGANEMYSEKSIIKSGIIVLAFIAVLFLTAIPSLQAQYWTALPPYNLLWPLWSPALSPVDAVTGLATPLVTSLSTATILPAQPALAWNPAQEYPWLFFNTPAIAGGGLTFFDPIWGLNPFPPASLLDAAGLPLPLTLPVGFGALPPTLIDFADNVDIAKLSFLTVYPTATFGISLFDLLTAGAIWGLPPL